MARIVHFLALATVSCSLVAPLRPPEVDLSAQSEACSNVTLRVHYARRDGLFDGWGLHVWGDAVETPTTWNEPLPFEGADDFGRYVDLRVEDPSKPLRFIIHRGDEKDVGLDRGFPDPCAHPEVWLRQGRKEVWTERPAVGLEVVWAWVLAEDLVRGTLEGPTLESPSCPHADKLSLRTHDGRPVAIAERWCEGSHVFIRTAEPLDLSANHFLSLGESTVPATLHGRVLDERFFYDGPDLGATLRPNGSAAFKLWSPPAVKVALVLFAPEEQCREIGRKGLVRGEKGVWSAVVEPAEIGRGSLDGCYYQYEVTAYGRTERALDPYARSMAAFAPGGEDPVGKAAVVAPRKADPWRFRDDDFSNRGLRGPARSYARLGSEVDFIGYELHVRDFTVDPQLKIPNELRGTFRGLVSERPLGYLKELGITHVQLLPVQNYFTVDESDRSFKDGRDPRANYNWGYDPHNYFAPEGWLSSNPADPYARIRELKELVQALHRARIGVVLDVVYNHVFDARIFETVAPGCYLRLDDEGQISGRTGAGPSVETRRRMVRKLVVDSARYFVEEYGVDGFRFDLMGFIDAATMLAIRDAVGEDVLLYGEAWDFTDLPGHEATTKHNLPARARLAAFSDSTRDAFAGREQAAGFVQGEPWALPRVRAGIIGNLQDFNGWGVADDPYDRFAREPGETLNYLSIHDGFTLWDKLNLTYRGDARARARLARLAMAMLFTSQGRVILHGGDEMGRTKPLAEHDPSRERAHTSGLVNEEEDLPGVSYFHENTYASPDYTNMVRWSRLEREPFRSLAAYTRELIGLRGALSAFRLTSAEQVRRGLRFLAGSDAPSPAGGAGYRSFDEVPELTIELIHGPANATCFLAGEVIPAGGDPNKNPPNNPFAVRFDEHGIARVHFDKSQVARFDLKGWADSRNLNIKLVLEPGKWATPPNAYTHTGNNTVKPAAIRSDKSVTIDLAIQDHVAGAPAPGEGAFVAFELDNTLRADGDRRYDRLVVVYNAGKRSVGVSVGSIDDPAGWRVLLDSERAAVEGITGLSEVWISRGSLLVPPQSAAVVGRLR